MQPMGGSIIRNSVQRKNSGISMQLEKLIFTEHGWTWNRFGQEEHMVGMRGKRKIQSEQWMLRIVTDPTSKYTKTMIFQLRWVEPVIILSSILTVTRQWQEHLKAVKLINCI